MYISTETKSQVENCSWIMEHNLMYFIKNEISLPLPSFFFFFLSKLLKQWQGGFPTLCSALYIVGNFLLLYKK